MEERGVACGWGRKELRKFGDASNDKTVQILLFLILWWEE